MFVCIYLLNIIIMPFVAAAAANSSTWQGLNGLKTSSFAPFYGRGSNLMAVQLYLFILAN